MWIMWKVQKIAVSIANNPSFFAYWIEPIELNSKKAHIKKKREKQTE